jgi:hypothetical protein
MPDFVQWNSDLMEECKLHPESPMHESSTDARKWAESQLGFISSFHDWFTAGARELYQDVKVRNILEFCQYHKIGFSHFPVDPIEVAREIPSFERGAVEEFDSQYGERGKTVGRYPCFSGKNGLVGLNVESGKVESGFTCEVPIFRKYWGTISVGKTGVHYFKGKEAKKVFRIAKGKATKV